LPDISSFQADWRDAFTELPEADEWLRVTSVSGNLFDVFECELFYPPATTPWIR
jgi:hypothetical protein